MSTKSKMNLSTKSKTSMASGLNTIDSDEETVEEPPLPLRNTMSVLSKLLLFMGASVIFLGSVIYTYFLNHHSSAVFGGLMMFLCGIIARYATFRVLAICNGCLSFISAIVSFYFWVQAIYEYENLAKYSKCVQNSIFPEDDYFHAGFITSCQETYPDGDCYCVDKHATMCVSYQLNPISLNEVNCGNIIAVYRYEVAGTIGALTIGTGLLILYTFVVINSICYQTCQRLETPACIKRCYACCQKKTSVVPEPEVSVPREEIERKRNHLVSKMLQDAADNAYNHQKDLDVAEEAGVIPRKVVVWEDQLNNNFNKNKKEVLMTPRREQRYVDNYIRKKYPHLIPQEHKDNKDGESKGSVGSDERSPPPDAIDLFTSSYVTNEEFVAPRERGGSIMSQLTSNTIKIKPSIETGVVFRKSSITSSILSDKRTASSYLVPTDKVLTASSRPSNDDVAIVRIQSQPIDSNISSSDDDSSDPTSHYPVSYSDDEYERPPGPGQGRFDYLDAAIEAKVALRIATYKQDLMDDPELDDHTFSLKPLPPLEEYPSHSLESTGFGGSRVHDVSTLQQEDSLWTEAIDYHPAYSSKPNYKVFNDPSVKIQPNDSLEGQILQPLHTTRAPIILPPYMKFTHLPPVSQQQQQHLLQATEDVIHEDRQALENKTPAEIAGMLIPREKQVYVQHQKYKQQMYLYQHY